ncbi:Cof-type HAD-IIB family hydrolase [Hydrogenoanaerobacterium sp.]|uniref:Cof-type HAD-IIB family hydrolase n=1 Tax=Hydrogenoanaerobacterium sp. TaxID=2953763 RepID=UPI0028A210A0|nr:Cof-type HAD-IIB family hydrolase [Hydrogenoanaerobacterium sp.]
MALLKKYLYSDMDGTLIGNDKTVSQPNINAIKEFISQGGEFSIATGRSAELALPYLTDVPLTMPGIIYNGAAVYDFKTRTYLHKWCIPEETMRRIVTTAIQIYPTVCAEICDGRPMQLVNPDCEMDIYIIAENQKYEFATLDSCGDCFKVLFYGEHDRLLEVEAALHLAGIRGISTCFSAPFYLEVLPDDASKGHALQWISENLGGDLAQTAAIGDFDNDITMLEEVGFGAAPSNARQVVKDLAQVIVAHHTESAVADLIYSHLLIE